MNGLKNEHSILGRLTREQTGVRIPMADRSPTIEVVLENTHVERPGTGLGAEEYRLSARVGVTFAANTAQLPHHQKEAEQHLARLLYGDLLSRISRCRHAVGYGDTAQALEVLDEMQRLAIGDL